MSKRILALAVVCASLFAASCQKLIQTLPQRSLSGGTRVILKAQTTGLPGTVWNREAAETTVGILEKRLTAMGIAGRVRAGRLDEFVVELPRIEDRGAVIERLKATTNLEFRHLKTVHYASEPKWRPPAGKYTLDVSQNEKGEDVYTFTDAIGRKTPSGTVLAESRVVLTGADLKPVTRATKNPQTFGTVVAIEFTSEGKKKFADFTRRNVGEILAIVLDKKILSAPTVRAPILGGRAQIEGKFTPTDAQKLAEFLNAGALPAPLEIVRTESIP